MNSVQLHLALTHVPVILSLMGVIMLVAAFVMRNSTVTKTSYIMLTVAGLTAIPVFFSGEGGEEAVENLSGISESVIESHEDVAKLAMISVATAGLFALVALFAFKWTNLSRILKVVVLLLALVSAGFMIQTAHLGGQIRHSEIRSGAAMRNENNGWENARHNLQQQDAGND